MSTFRKIWHEFTSKQNKTIQLYFILGRNPHQASARKDRFTATLNSGIFNVIRVNINEDYLNLTLKTIAMMKWISKYCTAAKYIAKLDDDTFVNIGSLMNLLENADRQSMTNVMFGKIAVSHQFNVRGKAGLLWDISSDSYPLNYWPHYANGFFYVFTNDITRRVLTRTAMRTTPVVNIEDAFLTGIVRVLENITLSNITQVESACYSHFDSHPDTIAVHHFDYVHQACSRRQRIHRRPRKLHKSSSNRTHTDAKHERKPSSHDAVKQSRPRKPVDDHAKSKFIQRKKYLMHKKHSNHY